MLPAATILATILATAGVSSSVTRRPWIRFGSRPNRRLRAEACGPPPCPTTLRMFPWARREISGARDSSARIGRDLPAERHHHDPAAVTAEVGQGLP
jgi:hypothetical protein